MKKPKLLPLIFLLFFLALSTLIIINSNAATTKTNIRTSSLDDIQLDQVDHVVKILEGGSIVINDTLHLSAKQDTTLTEYHIGFPYEYKYRLACCYAFETSNPSQRFNVEMDTGLQNYIGYYGITVHFPEEGIYLSPGQPPFKFTVVFLFSNVFLSSTYTYNNTDLVPPRLVTEPVLQVDFPLYPSLLQDALLCNVTILCAPMTSYTGSPLYMTINPKTTPVAGQILNLTKRSLEKLAYEPSWINFTSQEGVYSQPYRVITLDELERYVEIDEFGNIFVTDQYAITSHMQRALSSMFIRLPQGAIDVSAKNIQGKTIGVKLMNETTTTYSVDFAASLSYEESTKFQLKYRLSSKIYLNESGIGNFDLIFPALTNCDRVIGKFTLKISLPEGAYVKEYPNVKGYTLQKEALREKILFTAYNVSAYSGLDFHIVFVHSIFWASFRPTLWVTAIVAIGCVVALLWRAPKPTMPLPTPGIAVKPQTVKTLITSYEEKTKILTELESLERQAQKGRIPRRRYKVRKLMLENQISRLNRELVDLKQKVKSAGPKYNDLIRQLEVAEAELEGIEVDLKRVEARFRSGELSLDAYRRLQSEYSKRKEKTKTTIEGALLRLSEGVT